MADSINTSAPGLIQNRPYRSHRVPACTRCRSRKIRCRIDIPNQPCLSCRERRLKCQYTDNRTVASPEEETLDRTPTKRPRIDQTNGEGPRSHSVPTLPRATIGSAERSSMLLGPALAEDVDILQRHIAQTGSYQSLSQDARNPVIYLSVERHRKGLPPEKIAGKEQLEILEQILGPFKNEVVELYFTHTHHHFPILDDETCAALRQHQLSKATETLTCIVYAVAVPSWTKSDTLKLHPRPDDHYIWNKAISAVIEDFVSPSLATVSAAVLDMIGRPSVSIVGNITLCGRTVALAQVFGLHRDPSTWDIPDAEKSTRIRIWWGVLITDSWASIAYGTPPHVPKGFYDVPLPALDSLLSPKATPSQRYATTCFIHMCSLTELLGDILPLVYHVRPKPNELSREVDRLKVSLNELESQLPEWLPLPHRTGSSHLWFCFLSMRLLLSRLALRAEVLRGDGANAKNDRLEDLRTSSSAVLDFIMYLGESQFLDFWTPYAAHLLVLATMVSLRCTAEAQDVDVRNACILRLQNLIQHIQSAYDNYDWDIANYCLERCSEPVAKIAALAAQEPVQPQREPESTADAEASLENDGQTLTGFDDPNFLFSDLLEPNAFDISWESLWDTPAGMSNFALTKSP